MQGREGQCQCQRPVAAAAGSLRSSLQSERNATQRRVASGGSEGLIVAEATHRRLLCAVALALSISDTRRRESQAICAICGTASLTVQGPNADWRRRRLFCVWGLTFLETLHRLLQRAGGRWHAMSVCALLRGVDVVGTQ